MSVILEKSPSNLNTEKLRAILLLEVDFNTLYKIIFNNRMMLVLEVREEILQEIISSRRIQAATHLVLNKKLIIDIANTKKLPIVIMYTDIINFHDRVACLFASLNTPYFRLDIAYLLVLIRTIQLMKIFLHVLFGVLRQFYTGDNYQSFQRVVQGNGTVLPL